MESSTKTGATPLPEAGVDDGRILGLMPVKWRGMVHLVDGFGKKLTKMINVFENNDVYFEENGKFVRSQEWVQKAILSKLGMREDLVSLKDVEQG